MQCPVDLTALLAVLAVAGYLNRDKIAEVLKGLQGRRSTNPVLTNTDAAAGGLEMGCETSPAAALSAFSVVHRPGAF